MVDLSRIDAPISISMGAFDGVHLGHRVVIREAVKQAELKGTKSAVITFDIPPKYVLNGKELKLLSTEEEKVKKIKELGIDYYIAIPFTHAFASLSPEEFLERYIFVKDVRSVVVGFNFTFGHKAKGDASLLQKLCSNNGIEVIVIPPLKIEGKIVSSTLIRKLLLKGEVKEAKRYLGYNYTISGRVAQGYGIGKKLGVPTANLWIPTLKMLPKDGVYAVCVRVDDNRYPGACNIGHRPTFAGKDKSVEVHIIDYEDNAYGKNIQIEFLNRIRDERRFSSAEELIARIKEDIKAAKEIFETEGNG